MIISMDIVGSTPNMILSISYQTRLFGHPLLIRSSSINKGGAQDRTTKIYV